MTAISKLFIISIFIFSSQLRAQQIVRTLYNDSISNGSIESLQTNYGKLKEIPAIYQKQILSALAYYPELKDIKIKFRLRKKTTPLSTKPTFLSMFRSAKKRKYVVTISTKTSSRLEPILFQNLPFNAQIGVIGHELAHVSDYTTKGFGKMSYIFYIEMVSKKQTDTFESKTDIRCIQHGLGYQLLDWSTTVRKNLKTENWRGAGNLLKENKKERYLNPETIEEYIEQFPIYQNTKNGDLKSF